MSRIFASKGCYYTLDASTGRAGRSRGMYELSPSLRSGNVPILINSAPLKKSDISSMVSCLENIKILYSFGQAFGTITISGEVLLGPSGNLNSGEKILDNYFQTHRMSNYKKMIQLSSLSGGTKTPFFLVEYIKGNLDPERHILPFQFHGIVVDLQDKKK